MTKDMHASINERLRYHSPKCAFDTASGWNSLRVANFGGIKSWVAHERVVLAV
jgi:hypothetical protein